MNKRYQFLTSKLLLDELGNGSAVVGGEDADEIDSTVQVIDIDGVQLLGLSVAAHDLTTAQVVNHDLLYRFGTLRIKHARGGENDIVHPSAVAAANDTRVFLVAEFEGVRAEMTHMETIYINVKEVCQITTIITPTNPPYR